MRIEILIEKMIKSLEQFAAIHLNYPVTFSEPLKSSRINSIHNYSLKMKTSTGVTLLSFSISVANSITGNYTNSISVKIDDTKHLPVLEKFLNLFCREGLDIFKYFTQSVMEKSGGFNFIENIDIVPNLKTKVLVDNGTIRIDKALHATFTTPFETIEVYKMPLLIFEDEQFYLNNSISFTTLNKKYIFKKSFEHNINSLKNITEQHALQFHLQHYEYITKKINTLYNVSFDDFKNWSSVDFLPYYPALAMEHY
jgi:hypothetical protein